MTKKGICFIIEGFSGSGKTSLSQLIHKKIEKKYGKTVIIDGDNLRLFFKSINIKYGYSKKERSRSAYPSAKLINLFLNNNINIIYCNVGLNKVSINQWYKQFSKIVYIIIKSEIKKIIKFGKKKLYKNKTLKNIVGIDIKPYYYKMADIILVNDFTKPLNKLAKQLNYEIEKLIAKNKINRN